MKRKALALAIAICLLFLAVPGLVGFSEVARAATPDPPIEFEYKGTQYIQTWGIIPEEEVLRANLINTGEWVQGFPIYVTYDSQFPYDELYLRKAGYGCILYVRKDAVKPSTRVVEIGRGISPLISGNLGLATVPVNPNQYPTADRAARRVLGYWDNEDRGIEETKYLLYTGCTKNAVKSWLDKENLRYWYNIGHGNTDLIALYDGRMYYYEFTGLDGLNDAGIVLNSCYTYNGRLKQYITAENPAFYMAGKIALPVGPSEELSADFWYYYSVLGYDEVTALDLAVQENPGTEGWFGLWT
jgi:hypothetical protein